MKLTIEFKVQVDVDIEDGVNIDKVINEMDYDFKDTTGTAKVVETTILDYEVKKRT